MVFYMLQSTFTHLILSNPYEVGRAKSFSLLCYAIDIKNTAVEHVERFFTYTAKTSSSIF